MQVVVHGAVFGHVTQLMLAANPGDVMITSEVNTKVKQPLVAVTVPGDVVPVNVPIKGEDVLGPL